MNNLSKIITDYERACNELAHEFETILLTDYSDPHGEPHQPTGQWIGKVGDLYDLMDYYAVPTDDMATLLEVIEAGKLRKEDAYEQFTRWYDLMLKAASLKPSWADQRVHFVNLEAWLTGFPTDRLVEAIEEACAHKERWESKTRELLKDYGEPDNEFPDHFNHPQHKEKP